MEVRYVLMQYAKSTRRISVLTGVIYRNIAADNLHAFLYTVFFFRGGDLFRQSKSHLNDTCLSIIIPNRFSSSVLTASFY